jgi:hypothetical protein
VANTWEEWTIEDLGGGLVALKTTGGFYLTAEGGGGSSLSTNRRLIGPWEQFRRVRGGTASGFQSHNQHWVAVEALNEDPVVNCTRTKQLAWETFEVEGEATRPFPPEQGRLGRYGDFLRRENGEVFDWRGASMFQLFVRFLAGESIQPQLDWMVRHGVNIVRVWAAGDLSPAWQPFWRPWERPDYDRRLDEFFAALGAVGLRCEATVVTYQLDRDIWQRVLLRVFDVAARHWNVIVEVANEPDVGQKCDPVDLCRGIDTHGVLTSYGAYPSGPWTADFPRKDLMGVHLPRDHHFRRNSKDLLEMRTGVDQLPGLHVPMVSDEPIGVAEFDRTGAGARTTDARKILQHFAIARLFSCGATFHSQCGLEGRAPSAQEPITEAIACGLTQIWQYLPAHIQTGSYTRPGFQSFPVVYRDGQSDHPYASLVGDDAWLVMSDAGPQWTPEPTVGFRVVDTGPANWIVHLRR